MPLGALGGLAQRRMNRTWYRAKTMPRPEARCADSTPVIDRIYCHIVWTTRDRVPLIDAGLARFLWSFLRGVATQEHARILEIGIAVRRYLRAQPTHHPNALIHGWGGDEPEYEQAGTDEWRSEIRKRV